MNLLAIVEYGSIAAGLLSAACWVRAAVVKTDPPEELKGMPDGEYMGGTVFNGGDLIPTLRKQAWWNSIAAFAAAASVSLQVLTKLL